MSDQKPLFRPSCTQLPGRSRASRRLRRRAVGALATGLLLFLAAQASLNMLLEWGPPVLRDPPFGSHLAGLRRRMSRFEHKPCTVVMLGSSRTQFGYRAGQLEETLAKDLGRPVAAYNFGRPGAGPLMNLLTYQRLRREGIVPDLLLIEILPALFTIRPEYDEISETVLPTSSAFWHDLSFLKRYNSLNRPKLKRKWWSTSLVPWYYHRLCLLNQLAPKLLADQFRALTFPMDDFGDLCNLPDKVPEEARTRGLDWARREYLQCLGNLRLAPRATAALRELLEACRQDGIPAVLVIMPEGEAFRSWYGPGSWNTLEEFLGTLSFEYQVPLVDAHEWMEETDFSDSHHLLRQGREKFTERVGGEVILPLLQGQGSGRPWGREGSVAQSRPLSLFIFSKKLPIP